MVDFKFFFLMLYFTVKSDRCNCSMNCNTLIMAKRYRVTVPYVYLVKLTIFSVWGEGSGGGHWKKIPLLEGVMGKN